MGERIMVNGRELNFNDLPPELKEVYTVHIDGVGEITVTKGEQAVATTLERIAELEGLVQDVWAAYSAKAESSFHPAWEVDGELARRMAVFGFEVVENER